MPKDMRRSYTDSRIAEQVLKHIVLSPLQQRQFINTHRTPLRIDPVSHPARIEEFVSA